MANVENIDIRPRRGRISAYLNHFNKSVIPHG